MSGYSKFKILYIIRSYDERSGQKIAKSLAGKDICSDLTFRDAHAISAVDDIHEWTRDCLRSFFPVRIKGCCGLLKVCECQHLASIHRTC